MSLQQKVSQCTEHEGLRFNGRKSDAGAILGKDRQKVPKAKVWQRGKLRNELFYLLSLGLVASLLASFRMDCILQYYWNSNHILQLLNSLLSKKVLQL